MIAETDYQVLVRLDHTRSHLLHFPNWFISSHDILNKLSLATNIPVHFLHLHTPLPAIPPRLIFLSAFTKVPIQGGKGGFGTLLKGQSKQAAAKTTVDFGACRDLSGRRLRHVNDEILLRKWKLYQQQLSQISSDSLADGEDDEAKRKRLEVEIQRIRTESGLHNWNLMVPNWSEIAGSGGGAHPAFQKKQERIIKRELEEYWSDIHKKQEQQTQEKQKRHEAIQSYLNPLSTFEETQEEKMKRAIRSGMKKKNFKPPPPQETNDLDYEEEEVPTLKKQKTMDDWTQHITLVSGDVILETKNDIDVLLQSKANFSTVCVMHSSLYYEVKILSEGVAQIGWAHFMTDASSLDTLQIKKFKPNSDSGDGVGDDEFSFGYDGGRGLIFHKGQEQAYGEVLNPDDPIHSRRLWKRGDVIGCNLSSKGEIKFSINGIDQGLAFQVPSSIRLCPSISLNQDVIIGLRLDAPFEYII